MEQGHWVAAVVLTLFGLVSVYEISEARKRGWGAALDPRSRREAPRFFLGISWRT